MYGQYAVGRHPLLNTQTNPVQRRQQGNQKRPLVIPQASNPHHQGNQSKDVRNYPMEHDEERDHRLTSEIIP